MLSVGPSPSGVAHPKLSELILPDLLDFAAVDDQLLGYDGCIWAVGISSVGLDEFTYARVTEELTLLWARTLLRLNPVFSFCYCSAGGAGSRGMWARVRRLKDALRTMRFRHAGAVRPGFFDPRVVRHQRATCHTS